MATIRKLKSGKFEAQVRHKGYAPVSRAFPNKYLNEERRKNPLPALCVGEGRQRMVV